MSVAGHRLPRTAQRIRIKPEQQFLLHNVSWESYELIGKALGERRIRATYDRGRLELMMPSEEHERIIAVWDKLVQVLAEELNIRIAGVRSVTQQRKDCARGIEADDSYYTRNWPLIRGKRELDFTVDPPSDLALEVDVSSSSIPRLPVYAGLRVPEVWRFDGRIIQVLLLNAAGEYQESEHSPTFPNVPIQGLVPFLLMWSTDDDMTITRAFRAWLRQHLAQQKKSRRRRKNS